MTSFLRPGRSESAGCPAPSHGGRGTRWAARDLPVRSCERVRGWPPAAAAKGPVSQGSGVQVRKSSSCSNLLFKRLVSRETLRAPRGAQPRVPRTCCGRVGGAATKAGRRRKEEKEEGGMSGEEEAGGGGGAGGERARQRESARRRVGCGGGGGPAAVAAFSSAAPLVAMATRAVAIPCDTDGPRPGRGRCGRHVCARTRTRTRTRTPTEGPGSAGLLPDSSWRHPCGAPAPLPQSALPSSGCFCFVCFSGEGEDWGLAHLLVY